MELRPSSSDVAFKIREKFMGAWEEMADDGSCQPELYMWLLAWRHQLPHDTQDVEGANSVLQRMANAAPNLHIPLASDRLRIKLGTPISPQDCVDVHAA
eukprot:5745794-Pyramimonas_sp.AAC.1